MATRRSSRKLIERVDGVVKKIDTRIDEIELALEEISKKMNHFKNAPHEGIWVERLSSLKNFDNEARYLMNDSRRFSIRLYKLVNVAEHQPLDMEKIDEALAKSSGILDSLVSCLNACKQRVR